MTNTRFLTQSYEIKNSPIHLLIISDKYWQAPYESHWFLVKKTFNEGAAESGARCVILGALLRKQVYRFFST